MERRNGPGRRWGLRARQPVDDEAAQRTERLLRKLPEREWAIVSDADRKHGVDHVLVGPGGVFALASRQPEGVGAARVKDGMLWLRRGADPRDDRPGGAINRQALESARLLHREIRSRTGRGPVVQPVVVLWCEFPQAVAESNKIVFIRGRNLLEWVSHRPQRLDAVGREQVVQAVRAIPEADGTRAWRAPQIGGYREAARRRAPRVRRRMR